MGTHLAQGMLTGFRMIKKGSVDMNMNLLRQKGISLLFVLAASVAIGGEWFAPFQKVSDYKPKGATHCYRQFNVDWSWIALKPEQLPEFLSEADPVALAEFCRQDHVDGTVVMAVPHHGYCTYETRVGTKFPGMKGDWFGRTIEELHKRRIAAFGYVTLNWNWKYIREHQGADFIHGKPEAEGVFGSRCTICLNAPGYLEMVEAYTREVLENYPVDGMRWDILQTAQGCQCSGCKSFYRQVCKEELTDWKQVEPGRVYAFYRATTDRAVMRLRNLCKQIKPSVEVWQNHLQSHSPNNLDMGRELDIAYNEYGDPFRLAFIRGVTNKRGAINGLMNQAPVEPLAALEHAQWRTCLALGGRCYSYYGHKQTNPKTLLPNEALQSWHRQQLAPFYEMVSRIQPWLEDATPASGIGIVFSEQTRLRYPKDERKAYIAPMEAIFNRYLDRSLPIEFINRLDLADPQKNIARFQLLILPLTSGLQPGEIDCLRKYAERGGHLLVAGDALRYDDHGRPLPEFDMADALGVSYAGNITGTNGLSVKGEFLSGELTQSLRLHNLIRVRPVSGKTLLSVIQPETSFPLLHVNDYGKGKITYLASLDSLELTSQVIDWLSGTPPVSVHGSPDAKVILTHQPQQKQWILHLISGGNYIIDLLRSQIPATRVTGQFPADGWNHRIEPTSGGLRIQVQGQAQDRLLVLQ